MRKPGAGRAGDAAPKIQTSSEHIGAGSGMVGRKRETRNRFRVQRHLQFLNSSGRLLPERKRRAVLRKITLN
jgi:hypothetical protein